MPKKLLNSSDNELKKAINLMVEKLPISFIILFGSRARGDYLPYSDYDLLIIGSFKEQFMERLKKIMELLIGIKIHIEPHPYTLKEAINMLKRGHPTIYHALDEGIIIFERNAKERKKLFELFNNLKRKGMKRTDITIIVPR
ncbi:MAG: nucleotidyltransferase domain-containing protein [Candidatus Asgardarchaeia archaeon]